VRFTVLRGRLDEDGSERPGKLAQPGPPGSQSAHRIAIWNPSRIQLAASAPRRDESPDGTVDVKAVFVPDLGGHLMLQAILLARF